MDIDEVVLCPTKTGNGYKIVVNGQWLYTSKRALLDVVKLGRKCIFQRIAEPRG